MELPPVWDDCERLHVSVLRAKSKLVYAHSLLFPPQEEHRKPESSNHWECRHTGAENVRQLGRRHGTGIREEHRGFFV